ncbi:MAG: hypothetical protein B7Z06_11330, partial [Flavobacteriales bacterium 32-35-8]
NSILKSEHYEPEIIFIGTFNHGWYWNQSDFFYGRGMYMWPIMANLFIYNQNLINTVRNFNNDNPSLKQIFEICKKGKIAFADIVKGTKDTTLTEELNGYIRLNNNYNWNDYKDKHLNYLGNHDFLDDNVDAIIKYVNSKPSIKYLYFTFKTGGNWILNKRNYISENINIPSCSIFTPTGSGFRKNLPAPFDNRIKSLTHCWIWNNLQNQIPINKNGYCNLNHDWLIENGVNPENF